MQISAKRIIAVSLILVVGFLLIEMMLYIHQREERHDLVRRTMRNIALGMSKDEVEVVARGLGWQEEELRYAESRGQMRLATPPDWLSGFRNWILLVEFESGTVSALRVRTLNGEDDHPADAPPDIVQ